MEMRGGPDRGAPTGSEVRRAREPIASPHAGLLREAIRLAVVNVTEGLGGPFGAVVARDGVVVASGANAVTRTNDPTAHAEVVAIRSACAALGTFQLAGCVVYASCEPCPMCMGALYWARPDALYFAASPADAAAAGFDDAFIWHEFALPEAARSLPIVQLRLDDAHAPFEAWQASTTRIAY
ncbi:MAG: nucleoside deaminase [Candidatus Nanopelagicales bacterium]|jgi:tRNA(Arg) A34 adenosine deaminase TadA|nr:nucleoside deaminase [Candidatus Nanopelagicales bacterium]